MKSPGTVIMLFYFGGVIFTVRVVLVSVSHLTDWFKPPRAGFLPVTHAAFKHFRKHRVKLSY